MEYSIPLTVYRAQQILHLDRPIALGDAIEYRLVVGTEWDEDAHKKVRNYARIDCRLRGQVWQELPTERFGKPTFIGVENLLKKSNSALLDLLRLDVEIRSRT